MVAEFELEITRPLQPAFKERCNERPRLRGRQQFVKRFLTGDQVGHFREPGTSVERLLHQRQRRFIVARNARSVTLD